MLKILVLGFERCASVCLGSARYVLKNVYCHIQTPWRQHLNLSVYVPGKSQHRVVVELRDTLN